MARQKKGSQPARGAALGAAIRKKLEEKEMIVGDFASSIGLSSSYTTSLLSSDRPWDGTDREVKLKIAKFLEVPLINVLMLAEIVEPTDFLIDDRIEPMLDRAFHAIKGDQMFGTFCNNLAEWHRLPHNIRILIALLYEKVNTVELLEKAKMIKVERRTATPRTKKTAPGK